MRIARPREPEASFRRKRSPPPQATRLLTASLGAGVLFLVLLAVVFIPRGLDFGNQPPVAIVDLGLTTTAGTRLEVVSVTIVLEVGRFRADFYRNGTLHASLPAGLGGGGPALAFDDADGDGRLGPGDSFLVDTVPAACHRLEIFQVDVGARVAFEEWGACAGA